MIARSGRAWSVGIRLAVGGTSHVYEAIGDDGTDAVVKVLSDHRFPVDDRAIRRFTREIDNLAAVNHRHVLQVLDVAQHHGRPVVVLERAAASLSDVLRHDGRAIPLWLKFSWLLQAMAGVAALHAAGIVHRDLSPRNLLFAKDGRLLVGDFGTARAAADETITTAQDAMGSLLYVSQQQFLNAHDARPEDDVFSLGQIGYELFSGFRPVGNLPPLLTAKRRHRSYQFAGRDRLLELIDRMRAPKREDRPSDAAAALEPFVTAATDPLSGCGGEPIRGLEAIWRDRQLAAVASVRNTVSGAPLCLLADLIASLGALRLGVDAFRSRMTVYQRDRTRTATTHSQRIDPAAISLLGGGGARLHIDQHTIGPVTWSTAWLHNPITGRNEPLLGDVPTIRNHASHLGSLRELSAITDERFWSVFSDGAFSRGAPCADCGALLCVQVEEQEQPYRGYGKTATYWHGATYLVNGKVIDENRLISRFALCEHDPPQAVARCVLCGETATKDIFPIYERRDFGLCIGAICGCGVSSLEWRNATQPRRRLTASDFPRHLDTFRDAMFLAISTYQPR